MSTKSDDLDESDPPDGESEEEEQFALPPALLTAAGVESDEDFEEIPRREVNASRAHTLAVLSAIRRPRRKRKVGRIPRPLPPTRIAEAYAKAIRDRVCALARACFDEHAGKILHLLAERRRSMGRTDADGDQPRVPAGNPSGGEFAPKGGGSSGKEKEYHTIYIGGIREGVAYWGQQAATSAGLEAAKKQARSLQNKAAGPKGVTPVRIVKGRAALQKRTVSTAEDPETQHVYESPGWGERGREHESLRATGKIYRRTDARTPEDDARSIAAALTAAERAGRKQYERERRSTSAALTGATIEGRYAGRLLDRAAREFAEKFHPTALHAVVKQFGRRTDEHSRQQLDQQLRSAIGVPLSTIEKPARDKIDGWAATNVDRIVTVPATYFDRLRLDVEEAFEDGTRPEDLADSFVERYGMSERQAELIARDQVLKLAADLNHDRMQAMGVERATWRSMSDEKVCELCTEMEGVEFDLATGADGPCGPGTLPGSCHPADRCWSEPDLSDLIPDVDDS